MTDSTQQPDLAAQFDVRSVTVTWVGDDEFPEVEFEGCSQYEASENLNVSATFPTTTKTKTTDSRVPCPTCLTPMWVGGGVCGNCGRLF
jgi:hypothetical protein